jgi:hypothetical protein
MSRAAPTGLYGQLLAPLIRRVQIDIGNKVGRLVEKHVGLYLKVYNGAVRCAA